MPFGAIHRERVSARPVDGVADAALHLREQIAVAGDQHRLVSLARRPSPPCGLDQELAPDRVRRPSRRKPTSTVRTSSGRSRVTVSTGHGQRRCSPRRQVVRPGGTETADDADLTFLNGDQAARANPRRQGGSATASASAPAMSQPVQPPVEIEAVFEPEWLASRRRAYQPLPATACSRSKPSKRIELSSTSSEPSW